MAKTKDLAVRKSTDSVKKTDGSEKTKITERIAQWFRDLKSELKKVIWPTKEQTANNTMIALVVIVFFSVVLWGFDSVASAGVQALVSLVG